MRSVSMILAMMWVCLSLSGQVTSFRGSAYDQDHQPLADVHVHLLDAYGTMVYETTSLANGKYDLGETDPGTYTVQVVKDGFEAKSVDGMIITPRKITFMDMVLLEIGKEPLPSKKKARSKGRRPRR